jgi:hypothetical protein
VSPAPGPVLAAVAASAAVTSGSLLSLLLFANSFVASSLALVAARATRLAAAASFWAFVRLGAMAGNVGNAGFS